MLLANPPAQLHFTTEIHPRCISPTTTSFFCSRRSRSSCMNDTADVDNRRIYKVLQSIDEESEDTCKPMPTRHMPYKDIHIQRRSNSSSAGVAAVVAPYDTSSKESTTPSDNTISRSTHFPTPCARRRSSAATQLVTILEEDES